MPSLIYNLTTSRVKSIAFHPRRPWVLIACHDGFVELHDYVVGSLVERFLAHSAPVRACAFHENQPLFATGSDDRTIKLWDLESRKELATLAGHTDYIRYISFHSLSPWLASASDDCSVRVWNFYSRYCVGLCTGHKEFAMCCRFHPTCDLLATAALDGTVRVWDLTKISSARTQKKTAVEKALQKVLALPYCTISMSVNGESHTRGVNWVCWGENDALYSAADDFTVREWRLLRGKPASGEILGVDATLYSHATMTGHAGNVNAVECGRDNAVISASSDGTIRVYELKTRTFVGALSAADYGVTSKEQPCRFWCVAQHSRYPIWAAGHDQGMFIFTLLDNQRVASFYHSGSVFFCKDYALACCNLGNTYIARYNKLPALCARQGAFGAGKRIVQPCGALAVGYPFPVFISYDDGLNKWALSLLSYKSEPSKLFDCSSNIIKISNTQVLFQRGAYLVVATPSSEGASVQRSFKFYRAVQHLIQGFEANEFIACYERGEAELIRIAGDVLEVAKKLYFPFSIVDFTFSSYARLLALRSNRSVFVLSADYEVVSYTTISSNISAFVFASVGRSFESAPDTTVIFTTATHVCYLCSRNNISGVITSLNKELRVQSAAGQNMLFLDEYLEPVIVEFDSRLCGLMAAIADDRRTDAAQFVRRIKKNNYGNALTARLMQTGFYRYAIELVSDDNKALKYKLAIEMGDLPDEVEREFQQSYVKEACEYQYWYKAFKYADCEHYAYINVLLGSNAKINYKNSTLQQQMSAAMMMQDNYKFYECLKKAGLDAAACVFAQGRKMYVSADGTYFKHLDEGAQLSAVQRTGELRNWPRKAVVDAFLDVPGDDLDDCQVKNLWDDEPEDVPLEPEPESKPVVPQSQAQASTDSDSSFGEDSESALPPFLNPRSPPFKATGMHGGCYAVKSIIYAAQTHDNSLDFDIKYTDKYFAAAIDLVTGGNFDAALRAFQQCYYQYKFLQAAGNKLSKNASTAIYYIRGLRAEIQAKQVDDTRQAAYLALVFAQQQIIPAHRAKALRAAMIKLNDNNFGALAKMCAQQLITVSDELGYKGDKYKAKAQKYLVCSGGESLVYNFDFSVNYSTLRIEKCKSACKCCESFGDAEEECQICCCGQIE